MESTPLTSDAAYFDSEAQMQVMDSKHETKIRHGFIRKVYGIILSQLLLTSVFAVTFTLQRDVQQWILNNGSWLLITSSVAAFVLLLIMVCIRKTTRRYPLNYCLLGAFTVCEAITVGGVCVFTSSSIVLQALVTTTVIVIGLTMFAMQTKYDFTSWMPYMLTILMGIVVFGIIQVFFRKSRVLDAIVGAVAAVLFSVYILIDTQLILGNQKRRFEMDDYILAAMCLYVDIITLFLELIRFFKAVERYP